MKDNTVPLKLIALLANGEFHSGEQLGETLGMSRAAINKHIQTLRDWGVDVFTVPGKGYSLPEPIQLLNAKQILGSGSGGSGSGGHTLYAPGGYDIMGYLRQIRNRPNPQVELGPVDLSCALVLCDLKQKDTPVVYASEAFLEMTGYNRHEVLGRNCRFLQSPDGMVKPKSTRKYVDSNTIFTMKKAIDRNAEVQVEVVNFKKNGQRFVNFLTMIPVRDETGEYRYSIGFQCETEGSSGKPIPNPLLGLDSTGSSLQKKLEELEL